MLCEICNKRPANVHFTRIINGVKEEIHACEHCAREQGLSVDSKIPGFDAPFSISNILAGLMDFGGGGVLPYSNQKQLRCQKCGLSYDEFKNTGRFGCSECYDTFGDRLEPLIKRIHGNTQHMGKVPKRSGGIIRIKRDIEKLKYELKKAIDNEKYEEAAIIRDKIRDLEGKEGGR